MRLALAVLAGMLCALPASGQQSSPRLTRVEIPALDSIGPEAKSAALAINADGLIAFTSGFDDQKRAVTVIDSRGRILSRFGPPGRGPGELNPPLQVGFNRSDVFVLEVAGRRASRFSSSGKFLGMQPTPGAYFLLDAVGDSVDVLEWPTGAVPISDFKRVSAATMGARMVMGGQAATPRAMAENAKVAGAAIATVLYHSLGDNIIVANPNAYDIRVTDATGKELYAIKRPRDAMGMMTTFKEMGGLQVDARSRLWVIGDAGTTGHSIADVYLGPTFVRSVDLGCRGNVALAGDWLAILCTTTTDPSRDVELRVFRIRD